MSSESPSKNNRIIKVARSIKRTFGSLLQPSRLPSPSLIDLASKSDNHVAATSTVAGTRRVTESYCLDTDTMSPIAVQVTPDLPRQCSSVDSSRPETPPILSDHMVAASTAAGTSNMSFDYPPSFPVGSIRAPDTTVTSTVTDSMSPSISIPVTPSIPEVPRQFGSVGSSRPETAPTHLPPLNANSPTSLFQNAQINMNQPMIIVTTNVYQVSDANENEQSKARILCVEYDTASPAPRNACRKDTREAILGTLQVWANDKTATMVYWLSGMAGTGKTTIAYSFSEILCEEESLGGTFFSSHLRDDTRNVRCIIPTVALQLARDSREVIVPVIVLDALDECSDHSLVAELLAVILEHSTSLPVKFLITSRPDIVFKEYLDQSRVQSSSLHDYINPTPSSVQSAELNQERNQSQVPSQRQEIPLQKSNDIYERHLTPKGRGFPLWIPEPNQVLHISYRRTGIRIGDVGIITHSGAFSFLFNICLSHDDPVNPRVLPENFAPISPPIEAIDIERFSVFDPDSHLASASIERSQTSDISFLCIEGIKFSGIVFNSSASEGAILTMPQGAKSEDLGNSAAFRDYAAANIADWYKFVNGRRGREAKNGDVRLVVGFDKTTSWGIATFANQSTQNNCRLRFGPSERAGLASAGTYAWGEYSGVAEVKAGPGSNNNELRRDSDSPDVRFENQCLFVRTLNVTLADDVWVNIHSSLGSVHVDPRHRQYSRVKDYSNSNHPHLNNPGTSSSSSSLPPQGVQTGIQRHTGSPYGLQDVDVTNNNPTMFISGPLESLTAHPSKVLNDILLAKVPTAKMVITHDDDWSSIIAQASRTTGF
ncbi:hypothetical protein BYT27DRAFT_7244602 [Phlegmacium glaucopus]|nr:hypothetical protein BYT27DRAFT_7244602 [Phlegmacium glaucopus]